MHLMAQQPSSDFDVDQDREILYLATKTLFTQVQTFIPSSMCLVQAGVILASYERGHERIEAAYITIGTAARLASAIGIDTAQCSQELQGSDIWFDEEEALATWWGLMICDRNIACDSRMSGRPMAVRPIRDEDYLPLEPADLAGDIDYSMSPAFRYFVSAVSLPTLGKFGREAQATHLLDKVKRAVDLMETDSQTFVTLGYELQTLLGKVIRQVAEQRTTYCGAIHTLLVGLYILHRFAVEAMAMENEPEWTETMRVTLNTITRMTIDIVYGFNKATHTYPVEALAPAVQHVARCAQEHIMACDNFQDTQWQQDLEELRQLLKSFNTRWSLAGDVYRRPSSDLGN
ncbi:hypothetical protein LOCC1_G004833 [Lachnellula occidentalis]|uniref:Xylanolytic transcriptional activator regulatory domain-containing protein n=1 Tax=Lachnellula occidentalis TaxID=215460 RepID=A0A8H8RVM0_9HELO|nr:hypothetical protein LOCC1_G004833 [Lachnellula occidentalis]